MKPTNDTLLISVEAFFEEKMHIINGEKVLFDYELAELLQVPTKDVIRKVRANPERFPGDFLIKIPVQELFHLLPQSEKRRQKLYAFTLGGIMMAAGRFKTPRAVQISIKLVEFVCGRVGGMEEILDLIQQTP